MPDVTTRPSHLSARVRMASARFAPNLEALGWAARQAAAQLPGLPGLPLDSEERIGARLDLALATPAALVVRARLEPLPGSAHPQPDELGLVVPRTAFTGGRPLLSALLDAARAAIARATRGGSLAAARLPARLIAWVGGRPHLLSWVGLAGPAHPCPAAECGQTPAACVRAPLPPPQAQRQPPLPTPQQPLALPAPTEPITPCGHPDRNDRLRRQRQPNHLRRHQG